MYVRISIVISSVLDYLVSISAINTVHEVGRDQGVLSISVVFSTVHEVGREQGVLTISVVFSTVHEVGREQGVLTTKEYMYIHYPGYVLTNRVQLYACITTTQTNSETQTFQFLPVDTEATPSLCMYLHIHYVSPKS
jgi:nitrate reductase NapAB chaperone NapD